MVNLSGLDAFLSGYTMPQLTTFIGATFLMVWLPVPLLRARGKEDKSN